MTHNYPKVTYSYPKVTYSDPLVTHSDPTHLPLPPLASPGPHHTISEIKCPVGGGGGGGGCGKVATNFISVSSRLGFKL